VPVSASVRLEGIDLILEREATRVTDPPTLGEVARLYCEAGWPAQLEGEAFTAPYSAPSAGPPPWHLTYTGEDLLYSCRGWEKYRLVGNNRVTGEQLCREHLIMR
jgi:hypothetical protein